MKTILTLFLGSLFTLCFAPYHYFALGAVSFTGLFLILDKLKTNKQIFWHGFLFGFAHHVTGLYWISYSMLVEPEKFAWMIPFSASLIPSILALFIGGVCYLTYKLKLKSAQKIIFFTASWVIAEYLRGTLFTGFPWNLAGYTALSQIALAQAASIFGVYGLSALVILLFLSPYLAINFAKNNSAAPVYKYSIALYFLFPALLVYCGISGWGEKRIADNANYFQSTAIRIVQPNIPQKDKFNMNLLHDQLTKYDELSTRSSFIDDFTPNLIIWPEAAVPFNITSPTFQKEVSNILPENSFLILGSVRLEGEEPTLKAYNSVQFMNSHGEVLSTHYDKHHLVPFGEYVPLRKLLPGVEKIAKGIGDFNRGEGAKTIQLFNLESFSPNICYEIIFPGKVVDRSNRPKWLLTVTNDAWFGNTSGPHQHLAAARMRAIEEGLPVIRSANTGISAAIDPLGRILDYIEINKQGVIDAYLPSPLPETFFSKHGNKIILIICLFAFTHPLLLKWISKVLLKDQPSND